jgi:hypothetical protein
MTIYFLETKNKNHFDFHSRLADPIVGGVADSRIVADTEWGCNSRVLRINSAIFRG